jgi:hypothetical protein
MSLLKTISKVGNSILASFSDNKTEKLATNSTLTIPYTFTGAATVTTDITITKIGDVCILTIEAFTTTATATNALLGSTIIPVEFRPKGLSPQYAAIAVTDGGSVQTTVGTIEINSTGTINIRKNFLNAAFTNGTVIGLTSGSNPGSPTLIYNTEARV